MMNALPEDDEQKKARVQAYFGRTAESYVTSETHRQGVDLQHLLEIGEWNPQQTVLDVATGGGHTALAVAPRVAHMAVSDLTPRMLEKAREFLLAQGVTNATFQLADAEHLPFADALFDCVTCRIAPHHFPNVARAVQEVARVLKPNGLFLLIDNIAPADRDLDHFINEIEKRRDPSHGRSYTVAEWEAMFTQAGLQVEYKEQIRKVYQYDTWTMRAQLAEQEKAALERYILQSDERIKAYFSVQTREDGHLHNLSADAVLLKGRK
ncbi:MAG TPA: class I SAM-dependent methyltransferase [Ktedonobacteraceae bacterium]|nr:class I SAM-dependent methyltransferase [Ktedonobacteraceae bacterium]